MFLKRSYLEKKNEENKVKQTKQKLQQRKKDTPPCFLPKQTWENKN